MSQSVEHAGAVPAELPKQYRALDHEDRVRARWDSARAFHADARAAAGGRGYAIFIPPPNVTAALHLGHALNNTLQDVLCRAHRMMGRPTLWMPGTDHAGIATQTVVEKRVLAEEGKRRTDFPREAFVEKIQAFKDEYEARITDQLKRMGCSCDWERQRFTMDPVCARAVREAFFRLFRDGLIYRGKRLVNWDPVTQTALADDEVEMEEVQGAFAYLRYPLVHPAPAGADPQPATWNELARRGYPGADTQPGERQAWVTVATTRPETYLGDTAVAVNPRDPRAAALRGLLVELPLVGRLIPIIEDDYVVLPVSLGGPKGDPKAEFATGFLKVTPPHDPNDYELGRTHHLLMINVMAPDASISDQHGWTDVGDARLFVGKPREEARKLVLREFESRGLLEGTRPYVHSVGHSYRSHAPVEPYLSDQWYVKVTDERLAGSALRSMAPEQRTGASSSADASTPGDAGLRFFPARYARTFETWHENIRDWCISRQLWWGHRIPVWSSAADADETRAFLARLGIERPDDGELVFEQGGDDGTPLMVTRVTFDADGSSRSFCCIAPGRADLEREAEERGFTQDLDVLDTWFSSALWPLSTLGWPDAEQAARDTGTSDFPALLDAFNPSDVLCTAREIITLWVSRMVMFNRYFLGQDRGPGAGRGPLPFRDVFIHAMIQDGEGRKMSKSLGNGVDPLDIIATHGADAMRFTLCQMTTQTQDVRMPVEPDPATGRNTSPKFDQGRNFCNKLWNAARFAISILAAPGAEAAPPDEPPALVDRWMLSRLAGAIESADHALRGYEFNVYAQTCYDLLWRDFCDWYLEAIKPTVGASPAQRAVLRATLDATLRLLHPAMPFVTEAIYERLRDVPAGAVPGLELPDPPADRDRLLCLAGWPRAAGALRDPSAEAGFERVRTLVSAVREVRAQHQVPPKRRVTLHLDAPTARDLAEAAALVGTLAGVERIDTASPPPGAVLFRFEGRECAVSNLVDAGDAASAAAERERLERLLGDLEKSIAALEGRLANPGYAQRAPAHLVQQTKDQLDRARAERDAALTQRARLA